HADKSDPPFLLLHGNADTTVPFEQSVAMQKRLEELGVEAELFEAEGAGHGFFNRPPWYDPTVKRMEEFLEEHFRPSGSP
ncbi:MAG: alpha/beta hydrolase family protein, partial [Armatimonadota bacterium]